MTRRVLWSLVACVGCNEQFLTPTQTTVSAAPALIDLAAIPLGAEAHAHISIAAHDGAAKVLAVNLLPTLGTGFALDGASAFAIDPDGAGEIDIAFRPTEVGYASALVQIDTNTDSGTLEVQVRARAASSMLTVAPSVLDLGVVPKGATGDARFEVQNDGSLAVVLSGALTSLSDVLVHGAFPLTIQPDGVFSLTVEYTAPDLAPMSARVSFSTGAAVVPDVLIVRANDCERGTPEAYDVDEDGVSACGGDCDDADPAATPGRPELADEKDNDCDGRVDEGTARVDDDGDGWCEGPMVCAGTASPGDCDDLDASVAPAAVEVLGNGRDDDCDGVVDAGAQDFDHDGFGALGGDCDDGDPGVHPGAVERPNGSDDDCDRTIDEDTPASDDDGDGYCEAATCLRGALPGDCDDTVVTRSPAAPELPDHADNDCDSRVDEGTIYGDDDGDGFTEEGGDCDDTDPEINPTAGGC